MIPSLVVTEIRSALVEYLASTFALADDDVRDALSAFLEDEGDGIFRGPYLKVRTPFRSVEPGWRSPLAWLPDEFVPHAHQARAFERLSSSSAAGPRPTVVTTERHSSSLVTASRVSAMRKPASSSRAVFSARSR